MNESDDLLRWVELKTQLRTNAARSIRVRAGVGLTAAARVAGTTPATISRWESGIRVPRFSAATIRYARLLDALVAGKVAP